MAIDGVSRIDAVGQLAGTGQKAPVAVGQVYGRVASVALPGSGSKPLAPKSAGSTGQTPEKNGSTAGAATRGFPGPEETYVRIRYDKPSHTYIIQVRSASNDQIISEFPADAWGRFGGDMPLPKGMIVEKNQ